MANVVPVGSVAPVSLAIPIVIGESGLDLRTVTNVSLRVLRSDAHEVRWAASIQSATHDALAAAYTFLAGDLLVEGTYLIVPVLTTASGTIQCFARQLIVSSAFSEG